MYPYKFILDQRFSIFEMFKDNPSSKTIFIHLYFRFVDMLYANMLIEHKQSSMKSFFFKWKSTDNQGTEEHLCGRSRLAFYNGFAVPGMLPERAYCAPMANVYYGKREYWSSSSRVVVRSVSLIKVLIVFKKMNGRSHVWRF